MPAETVLITGASSGIGRELARLFAADRANLVLVGRRRQRLDELAAELRAAHGVEALVMPRDLAECAAPRAVYEQLAAGGTTVDVLVNNAGFGAVGTVAGLPAQRQTDMIRVNVLSLTELTRLFLPGMIERGRGGVLNVSSTAAFQPGPNMAVYYATKAYVLSFTEALAEELAGTPIRVTCLAPGATRTEFAAIAGMEKSLLFRLGPMDAAAVARAGYRGFRRGRLLIVPGLRNKLGALMVRLFPRAMVRKVVKRLPLET